MSVKFISIPTKTLADSITSSASAFRLNNITGWDGSDLTASDFGSTGYGVFRNPTNTLIEFFEFDPSTIADSTITITRRGLYFNATDLTTEVAANKLDWNKGDTFVDLGTDTPQMLQWLKEYIDAASIAGAVPATDSVQGIVKTSTPAVLDAGTADDGTYQYVVTADLINSRTYLVDSGVSDAYVITPSPAITSYVAGQTFTFKSTNANTGSSTLNVSGLGTKTLKRYDGENLISGNIVDGQMVTVVYDGTDFIVKSELTPAPPQVVTFTTVATSIGDSTTQFDITNPSGDTFRYSYDATGTDPSISSSNPATGDYVYIYNTGMATANEGVFEVIASGTNYFEVTNASGVVESNKTIGSGGKIYITDQIWNKDDGLRYIVVEVQGAGGGGATDGSGGSGGGYSRKLIPASSLASSVGIFVGAGGAAASNGEISSFDDSIVSIGGAASGGAAGTSTGGDLNLSGQVGSKVIDSSNVAQSYGGNSYFGYGGININTSSIAEKTGVGGSGYGSGGSGGVPAIDGSPSSASGAAGEDGIIVITEYYA